MKNAAEKAVVPIGLWNEILDCIEDAHIANTILPALSTAA
jgi:hypothetical protein